MMFMNVSRHSLIFGLSYALDIAGKNNLSHSKSTAYLSVLIGRKIGLNEHSIREIYYAALLHDIGLSNTYKILEHCIDGEKMVRKLPLSDEIAESVFYHHEFYDGSGVFRMVGDYIPIYAQIISFSSMFDDNFGKMADVFNRNLYAQVCQWLSENRQLFSNEILNAFETLITQEFFLLDYFNRETMYTMSKKIIVNDNVFYGFSDVLKYARCFADIIDRKSRFTYTHSNGIARLAQRVTAHLGYDAEMQNKMHIAGLLHDIGKLHTSVDILHKPDKLDSDERFEINKHPYYTRKILEQIQGFEDITEFAANHHEKLDGSGYPSHIISNQLHELDKVMAICDIYQALTEERPYREKLPDAVVWKIINEMAESKFLDKSLSAMVRRILSLKLIKDTDEAAKNDDEEADGEEEERGRHDKNRGDDKAGREDDAEKDEDDEDEREEDDHRGGKRDGKDEGDNDEMRSA
jgi:putative nucleotidyltransferase with HDIG domain